MRAGQGTVIPLIYNWERGYLKIAESIIEVRQPCRKVCQGKTYENETVYNGKLFYMKHFYKKKNIYIYWPKRKPV